MSFLPGWFPGGVQLDRPALVAFAGALAADSTANAQEITATLGEDHASRYVYLLAESYNANAVIDALGQTDASIGGEAMTRLNTPGSANHHVGLWAAPFPTGASAAARIERSVGNGFSQVYFTVWAAYRVKNPLVPLFTRLIQTTGFAADPVTANVDTQDGGIVIGQVQTVTSASPLVWSGGWTFQGEDTVGAPNTFRVEGAMMNDTVIGTTALTVDTPASNQNLGPLIASFR